MYTSNKILIEKLFGGITVLALLTLIDFLEMIASYFISGIQISVEEWFIYLPACTIFLIWYIPRCIIVVRNSKIYSKNVLERFRLALPDQIFKLKTEKPDYNSFLDFLEMSLNNGVDEIKLNSEISKEKYMVDSIANVYDKTINGEFVPASGKLLLYQISAEGRVFLAERIWY